jgi:hypothetical protein
MERNQRLTASLDGTFVVFLIGMRVNRPLRVDKWLPVVAAMTRMIAELRAQPRLGLELTRFRGHFILWSKGVHDAEVTSAVPDGVSPADGRAGACRAQPG